MKKSLPKILLGFILISLLDIFGSIASRKLNFNYTTLAPISYIIYVAIPFIISRQSNRMITVISGGLLGLFDVTVGLKISMILNAKTGDFNWNTITLPAYIILVIFMIIQGSLLGLLAYWLAAKFSKKKVTMTTMK
jgi:hypothetical protein